jgi:rubrerythrin
MTEMREMSFGLLSALFSNLSKGCEKQYRPEEAELFNNLAEYYKSKNSVMEECQLSDLFPLMEKNINLEYAHANEIASGKVDRGSLRALLWGEKVTRILRSLSKRYEKDKDSLLENTHIYVCEICGFVYLGDEAPGICPVCKVPNLKIIEVKRG